MEFDDLEAFVKYVTEHFPDALWGEDEHERLVIYTNMFLDPASQAVRVIPEDSPLRERAGEGWPREL